MSPCRRLRTVNRALSSSSSCSSPHASKLTAHHASVIHQSEATGEARARAVGNRGRLQLGSDGRLVDEQVRAFVEHGFYVFEGVVQATELQELQAELAEKLDRRPVSHGSQLAADGGPAFAPAGWTWAEPLSDPTGGKGRAPTVMRSWCPAADAPVPSGGKVVSGFPRHLVFFGAGLRLYAHPQVLAIAATLHGKDFCRFNEGIIIKLPHTGPSIAWHQDGTTNWHQAQPDHGTNFQTLLTPSTAQNGVWIVPGSHRLGKLDIAKLVREHGERLPSAVPVIAQPGDVCIFSRNVLHCSFPNLGPDLRVSFGGGFQRRTAVLGARFRENGLGALPERGYSATDVQRRSEVIPLAIETRHRHFPSERPFHYWPCPLGQKQWNDLERTAALAQPMLAT